MLDNCNNKDSVQNYFFNTLPSHPAPKPLESLTGYLMRLANLNGIKYFVDLQHLFYPDTASRVLHSFNDSPLASFGEITVATHNTEQTLLTTTFYHLIAKFGRLSNPVTITRFLTDSIAPHLRFCPLCLRQNSYYRLAWRFFDLSGCAEHNCRLMEKCYGCNQPIPLFAENFKIGFCSNCKYDLKASPLTLLKFKEKEHVSLIERDLQFLLTPHPCESQAPQLMKAIGKKLRRARLAKQTPISQITKSLGLESGEIIFMDDGRLSQGTASFHAYLIYSEYLGLSLFDLFSTAYTA